MHDGQHVPNAVKSPAPMPPCAAQRAVALPSGMHVPEDSHHPHRVSPADCVVHSPQLVKAPQNSVHVCPCTRISMPAPPEPVEVVSGFWMNSTELLEAR